LARSAAVPHEARLAGELPGDPPRRYPEALTEGDTLQARHAERSVRSQTAPLIHVVSRRPQVSRHDWRAPRGGMQWREAARTGKPALLCNAPLLGDTSSKVRFTAAALLQRPVLTLRRSSRRTTAPARLRPGRGRT
jgi:hypothetical protein